MHAHRWITASGERRDTCGECGLHAVDALEAAQAVLDAAVTWADANSSDAVYDLMAAVSAYRDTLTA